MTVLKRFAVLLFLGLGVAGTVTPAPVYAAADPQDVIDLINIRLDQLNDLVDEQEAIINNPASTPAEIIEAQAVRQNILIRIAQLTGLLGNVNSLDPNVLMSLAGYLQFVISNS